MNTLVTGGTDTVGSAVVQELLARKVSIRILRRNADKTKDRPPNADVVTGDLLDPGAVRQDVSGISESGFRDLGLELP